jgi:type IV pilus assembly PilX-like protein
VEVKESQQAMTETQATKSQRPREAGIALVLAIMALLLLTFLGLTLAATTSTELQIATNYRWSEQARYNAEAGIEAGKVMLRNIPTAVSWSTLLPTQRVGTRWNTTNGSATLAPGIPAGSTVNDDWGNPPRNFENAGCDNRGGNVGYGVVLNDVGSTTPQGLMQNKTVIFGQRLNGAVTIWVRRSFDILTTMTAGNNIEDNSSEIALVMTAEGVAPYSDGSSSLAFATANQATHVYEVSLLRQADQTDPCEAYRAQAGNGVSGSGFAVCGALRLDCNGGATGQEDDLLGGGMGQAARDQGGTLGFGSGTTGTFASKQDPANPGKCVQ